MAGENRAKAKARRAHGKPTKRKHKEVNHNGNSEVNAIESTHHIHDGFFKALIQLPGNAKRFLQERLPKHLAKQLGGGHWRFCRAVS